MTISISVAPAVISGNQQNAAGTKQQSSGAFGTAMQDVMATLDPGAAAAALTTTLLPIAPVAPMPLVTVAPDAAATAELLAGVVAKPGSGDSTPVGDGPSGSESAPIDVQAVPVEVAVGPALPLTAPASSPTAPPPLTVPAPPLAAPVPVTPLDPPVDDPVLPTGVPVGAASPESDSQATMPAAAAAAAASVSGSAAASGISVPANPTAIDARRPVPGPSLTAAAPAGDSTAVSTRTTPESLPSARPAPGPGAARVIGAPIASIIHEPLTVAPAATLLASPEPVAFGEVQVVSSAPNSITPAPTVPPSLLPSLASASFAAASPAASPTVQLPAQLAGPIFTLSGAAPGEHVLTINVTPDDLGPVTVRAHVTGDSIRVELFAPTDAARDALRAIMPDLRRDLAGSGMNANLDLSSHNQPADTGGDSTGRRQVAGLAKENDNGRAEPTLEPAPETSHDGTPSTIDVMA
jgi:flagellar hook-length control protein FliK